MTTEISPASGFSDIDLRDAMCAAFADYAVPMQPSQSAWDAMMRQRGLDRGVSHVAVKDGRIVAIWLVARRGDAAYLISSGTIPECRGMGLARNLASVSIGNLRAGGASTFQTEVLQGNLPAFHLYQSLGMEAARDLACFALPGPIAPTDAPDLAVTHKALAIHLRPWAEVRDHAAEFADWQPSWQNDALSLTALGEEATGLLAEENGVAVGAAALVLGNETLAQISVRPDKRRLGIGTALVLAAASSTVSGRLRVLNAQADDAAFATFMAHIGGQPSVQQIELSMSL